eukprot:scaffold12381_cov117-Isochrysis_galbana.AAC.1
MERSVSAWPLRAASPIPGQLSAGAVAGTEGRGGADAELLEQVEGAPVDGPERTVEPAAPPLLHEQLVWKVAVEYDGQKKKAKQWDAMRDLIDENDVDGAWPAQEPHQRPPANHRGAVHAAHRSARDLEPAEDAHRQEGAYNDNLEGAVGGFLKRAPRVVERGRHGSIDHQPLCSAQAHVGMKEGDPQLGRLLLELAQAGGTATQAE